MLEALRQYHHFKAKHAELELLLLFLIGGEWLAFHRDADVCEEVLGSEIRHVQLGQEWVHVAAVSQEARDESLKKLLRAGHRVALCEPAEQKAVV